MGALRWEVASQMWVGHPLVSLGPSRTQPQQELPESPRWSPHRHLLHLAQAGALGPCFPPPSA